MPWIMNAAEPMGDGLFYLLVAMFLLGCATLFVVVHWWRQWRSPAALSKHEARDAFADLMSQRLGAAMRCAELDQIIIEHWEAWPVEYRPALYQVLRQTQLLEETMLEEAMQKGIYPKRVTTAGGLVGPAPQPPVLPPEPPAPAPPSDTQRDIKPDNVVPLTPKPQSGRWISVNGQFVRHA